MEYREEQILLNLAQLRKQAGFTQKSAESRLQLRPGTIYDYEKGRLKLSLEMAVLLCNLYHCQLDELLATSNDAPKSSTLSPVMSPLMNLGVINDASASPLQEMRQDPIIVAEIGLDQLDSNSTVIQLLLTNLSVSQQRGFLLNYIATSIP